MSYRDTTDTDRETYGAWAARIAEDVRELERMADTDPERLTGNLYSAASSDPFAIPRDGNDR